MRVFVAVEISNDRILKNIETFQKNVKIDAKPTKIDQIHFTLKFLGEIDENGGESLTAIANEIGIKLTSLGFENDKKFKPHLTIFRVKKKINDISVIMKVYQTIEFGTQTVSKIKVKRSVLSPKGPEYSDLLEVNAK